MDNKGIQQFGKRQQFLAVNNYISERIKKRRKEIDMPRKELAEKVGVTPRMMKRYENGTTFLRAYILCKVAFALGKDLNWFVKDMPQLYLQKLGSEKQDLNSNEDF